MTYEESVGYLTSLGRFGIKLGLERTEALLDALGDPHHLFQGVHVGGTNGKGSVCAMVAAVLQREGYRVGLMPKPHLVSYTERIQVDQRPIAESDFAALITEIQPVIQRVTEAHGAPTEFEILTSAALYYFARAGIDLLVCEVGLGGRLDSTNVLDLGVIVITNVALDHTQHLGSTLKAIAVEKAGILKPDSIALTGARPPGLQVIEASAQAAHVPLLRLGTEITVAGEERGWSGVQATVTTPADTYRGLRAPLLGAYQADNLALAVGAVEALRARGWEISDGTLRDGLARTRWPGRLEVVARRPTVLVDGAHNPDALAQVIPAVQRLRAGRRLVIVFGAMADKDLPSMMAELHQADAPIVFSGINWHRAAPPTRLAELYGRPSAVTPGAAQALAAARQIAGADGIVLVCGSLYLVGEVIQLIGPGHGVPAPAEKEVSPRAGTPSR